MITLSVLNSLKAVDDNYLAEVSLYFDRFVYCCFKLEYEYKKKDKHIILLITFLMFYQDQLISSHSYSH